MIPRCRGSPGRQSLPAASRWERCPELPPAPALIHGGPFLVSGMGILLCKVEVCFDLIDFARLFLVTLWEEAGMGCYLSHPA